MGESIQILGEVTLLFTSETMVGCLKYGDNFYQMSRELKEQTVFYIHRWCQDIICHDINFFGHVTLTRIKYERWKDNARGGKIIPGHVTTRHAVNIIR